MVNFKQMMFCNYFKLESKVGELMSSFLEKIREILFAPFTFRPSNSLLAFLLIVVSIFVLGGGVYDILEKPISVLPTPTNPIFYYPGMTNQTFNESLIFILFLVIGVSGGYLSFRSTRRVYRPREAKMFLTLGVAMMIIASIGCEILLMWKGL